MVIEGVLVFFGAVQNPCPNILVLDVLEVLDAMAALMLEELAALHWDTVNQVRTATEISRFALGQVDPTAALGGTAANLPHFLSSRDLVKPTVFLPEVWITTPRQVQAMESQLEQQRFEAARLRISLGHGRKGAYLVTCPTMVGTDLAYVNHYPLYFLYGQRRQRRRQR